MKAVADNVWPAIERRKPGWALDWQSTVERDKAALASSLHDNTGGLLIAAVMDITWAQNHLHLGTTQIKERLSRAQAALDVAIDLNRRMVEDLRPTLLDNFGLIAALRWHFAQACKTANIVCHERLPDSSPTFSPAAAIALFRVAQTLISLMVSHEAKSVSVTLSTPSDFVTLSVGSDGLSEPITRQDGDVVDALASVTGRVRALGGDMQFETTVGGVLITCYLPTDTALAASNG